jgi:hypothetical protein
MSEIWHRKVWKVQAVENALRDSKVLMKGNAFWLEPLFVHDTAVLYTVRFDDGMMNAKIWKDVRLVPIGSTRYKVTLPVMQDPPQAEYDNAVLEVKDRVRLDPTLLRLEGVITVEGVAEVVRFFGFIAAQSGDRDWMMLEILTTDDSDGRQNGTGHGDPW